MLINAIYQPYSSHGKNLERNDERLQVQESVMKIIGRLNKFNKSETMPDIRNMINELWQEIDNPNNKVKQGGARLIKVLFENANQQNAALYVNPTVQLIVPLLQDPVVLRDTQCAVSLINCLGAVAAVNESGLRQGSTIKVRSV